MQIFKGCLWGLLLITCWVMGIKYEIDLVVLHATAQFLQTDYTRVYAQNGALGRYFYGPFSLVLIKPLGFFSFPIVKYFWLCLQTFCLFIFWRGITTLYPFLKDKKCFWGWLLIWIISINPIHNNFQSNNIQIMLGALLIVAEQQTRKDSSKRETLAGLLVSFAAGIKVFPAFLVIYYFLARNNATKKGIILGCLYVALLPFPIFGIQPTLFLYGGFFSNLTNYSVENGLIKINDILCLPSLLARLGFSATSGHILVLIISALFFITVLCARRTFKVNKFLEPHFLAMAWALSVFLNPSSRPHNFIFYIPAFCSILEVIYSHSRTWVLTLGLIISTLMIAFTAEGVVGKHWNEILEAASIPTYGMLLLIIVLGFAIEKVRRGARNSLPSN